MPLLKVELEVEGVAVAPLEEEVVVVVVVRMEVIITQEGAREAMVVIVVVVEHMQGAGVEEEEEDHMEEEVLTGVHRVLRADIAYLNREVTTILIKVIRYIIMYRIFYVSGLAISLV